MTLHQQHRIAIRENIEADTDNWGHYGGMNDKSINESAAACSEISKEYAKGFARWCSENEWRYDPVSDYWDHYSGKSEKPDQLLALYDDHLAKLEKEKIK